jgi:hypothetical protein
MQKTLRLEKVGLGEILRIINTLIFVSKGDNILLPNSLIL